MLYGPANEPLPNRNARDGTGDSNNPQSGAAQTKRDDLEMLTEAQALDATTGDDLAPAVGQWENRRCSTTHTRAPLIDSPGCYELDAHMSRMTPMAAAARRSFSLLVAATQAEMLERTPLPRPAWLVRSSQTPRFVRKCLNMPRLK